MAPVYKMEITAEIMSFKNNQVSMILKKRTKLVQLIQLLVKSKYSDLEYTDLFIIPSLNDKYGQSSIILSNINRHPEVRPTNVQTKESK